MRNLYKKLSFVMVMGISLSSYAAWNGDATAWTQGDGSEQNPFLIENEAQLSHLQQTVTAGETYQGKFFRLTADLDMAGKQMPSIGNYNDYTTQENPELVRESKVFRGTFDGDFHTIDNLTIVNNNADPTLGGVGLLQSLTQRLTSVISFLEITLRLKVVTLTVWPVLLVTARVARWKIAASWVW